MLELKPIQLVHKFENLNLKRFPHAIAECCKVLNRPLLSGDCNITTTQQTKRIEVYGWKSPVPEHVDGMGYAFFMPIHMESEEGDSIKYGDEITQLEVGGVYLFDDRLKHCTLGSGNVVALFIGAFSESEITEDFIQSQVAELEKAIVD